MQRSFSDLSIEEGFSKIAEIGYQGVEIAPFTLRENPLDLDKNDAIRCLTAAKSAGIEIVGLHWLMAKTEGLHLTHSDQGMRQATSDYLKRLTELTAQMGEPLWFLAAPNNETSNMELYTKMPLPGLLKSFVKSANLLARWESFLLLNHYLQ